MFTPSLKAGRTRVVWAACDDLLPSPGCTFFLPLLFQTKEAQPFSCCPELTRCCSTCAVYNLAVSRVVTTLVITQKLREAHRMCPIHRIMRLHLLCSQMWCLGGIYPPRTRSYFTGKKHPSFLDAQNPQQTVWCVLVASFLACLCY